MVSFLYLDQTFLLIFVVVFQSFITNAHRKQVANALSAKRGKIIDFARDGVCDAFQLLAPRGHSLPPTQYRIARVSRLIQGADPLLFMHDFYFDEVRRAIIKFYYLLTTSFAER
jgi:hypothetical protein